MAGHDAVVVAGQARFTVLTPQLVRMEYHPGAAFEDHASLVFINRRLQVPAFTQAEENGWLVIRTGLMRVKYLKGSGPFTKDNLQIELMVNGLPVTWHPGMKDEQNLHGTTRTLDGWNGGKAEMLETGLLSRSGWAVVDDSRTLLFDYSDWPWVMPRKDTLGQDLYFFGHGHEYKKALGDFIKVAGRIPIPPRFAFGYWWSRYWVYSDTELRELVQQMKEHKIPMDVLIIDMDWHETYGLNWTDTKRDPFNQMVGWTGYTWNKALFPDPAEFLRWTEREKLKTALNLHPASGVSPMEERYDAFAAAMGVDTAGRPYIPYEMETKKFAQTYFDILLKPLEQQGIDFWWIDWQQWLEAKKMKGLSNTWWLNYTFFTRAEREGRRPLLFHRWGGLGNHRYQIGFSGDALITWKSLDFEPYFTATASNVGYGYWSHDIGGHIPAGQPTDPELYLRWLQFGALSPMLRTHATKSSLIERRFWMFPGYFEKMRDAVRLRYSLFPYLYQVSRQAYETGISPCRPMYYEYPELPEAYEYPGQYYLGDRAVVAPVTSPADKGSGLARKKIWLPDGLWYEWSSGTLLEGGNEVYRQYSLGEIPLFFAAGSVIPMLPGVDNLQAEPGTMVITCIPGGSSGSLIYEDDGNTTDYMQQGYAFTSVRTENPDQSTMKITILPRVGVYLDMPANRAWEIRLPSCLPPLKVDVNGTQYMQSGELASNSWSYTASDQCVHILTPGLPCDAKIEFIITFPPEGNGFDLCNGMKGEFSRLSEVVATLKEKAEGDYFLPDDIYRMEQTWKRIDYETSTAAKEMKRFRNDRAALRQKLLGIRMHEDVSLEDIVRHLDFKVSIEDVIKEKNEQALLAEIAGRVTYNTPYSTRYTGGGDHALFDGRRASPFYGDEAWQGFRATQPDIVFDLGETKAINKLSVSALQNTDDWIFLPRSVTFLISSDGKKWKELGMVFNELPAEKKGAFIKSFTLETSGKEARYVRMTAECFTECPGWHPSKGGKAWVFMDEIEIR